MLFLIKTKIIDSVHCLLEIQECGKEDKQNKNNKNHNCKS